VDRYAVAAQIGLAQNVAVLDRHAAAVRCAVAVRHAPAQIVAVATRCSGIVRYAAPVPNESGVRIAWVALEPRPYRFYALAAFDADAPRFVHEFLDVRRYLPAKVCDKARSSQVFRPEVVLRLQAFSPELGKELPAVDLSPVGERLSADSNGWAAQHDHRPLAIDLHPDPAHHDLPSDRYQCED
jgi:hypothetical protein